ncbi:MAG: M15 family peptidase, partial [Hyphomicrobium sp.]
MRRRVLFPILAAAALLVPADARVAAAAELSAADGQRLLEAYPEQLERIDGEELVWKDGTRMRLDDGKGDKPFEEWLEHPDVADMFAKPYPAGAAAAVPPAKDDDPGRARNAAFFDKVYGNCRAGEVERNLTSVAWLPTKSKQRLPFSK